MLQRTVLLLNRKHLEGALDNEVKHSGVYRFLVEIVCAECNRFESSYMMDLVRELKLRYPDRFIFINAPNISASSEIQVLTNICDWIVFEVPYDRVSSGGIADALEVVGQDKVAGVVFTQ